jgi:nitrogen regulatory protein P-II 1
MKKITAIIRPEKLDEVRKALDDIGFSGMTVSEVKGRGVQKGITLEWRAGDYRVEFLPKIKLEVIVNDKDFKKVIDVIIEKARTGKIGDGKIFVSDIDNVIRIRTGEEGEKAL